MRDVKCGGQSTYPSRVSWRGVSRITAPRTPCGPRRRRRRRRSRSGRRTRRRRRTPRCPGGRAPGVDEADTATRAVGPQGLPAVDDVVAVGVELGALGLAVGPGRRRRPRPPRRRRRRSGCARGGRWARRAPGSPSSGPGATRRGAAGPWAGRLRCRPRVSRTRDDGQGEASCGRRVVRGARHGQAHSILLAAPGRVLRVIAGRGLRPQSRRSDRVLT